MTVTVPIPQYISVQELVEIAQAVRQASGVEKLSWDNKTGSVVMRDLDKLLDGDVLRNGHRYAHCLFQIGAFLRQVPRNDKHLGRNRDNEGIRGGGEGVEGIAVVCLGDDEMDAAARLGVAVKNAIQW